MSDFLHAFPFFFHHLSLFRVKSEQHLAVSFAAIGIGLVLAIPLGVWLGHLHRGSFVAINISNIGRALPSLAVIAIGLGFLGIGFWDTVVALIILGGPVMMTNAYVAVDQVDPNAVQAARAMGMRPWQVLTRVELPLAVPLIFAGIRTATVYVISTATLATFSGGGGLGDIIIQEPFYHLPGVYAGAIAIMVLALGFDGLLALVQRAVSPKPMRDQGRVPPRLSASITESSWETSGLKRAST